MVKKKEIVQKMMNLLHFAKKAGKLKFGFDACKFSCLAGDSALLILASDLAENSKKEFFKLGQNKSVKLLELATKSFFGESFNNREVGIISVEDVNFANGIMQLAMEE